jgi:hypothetical protein
VSEADNDALPTEVAIVERIGYDGNAFHQSPFEFTRGLIDLGTFLPLTTPYLPDECRP